MHGRAWHVVHYLALDDEDEVTASHIQCTGQVRNMLCISEAGLYSLILRSRKPEAKAYKRWVTHEVIPAIRKHRHTSRSSKMTRLR